MRRVIPAAIAAMLLMVPVAHESAAADKVRFVQSSWGFLFVPAMVAQELGYFAEQGIEAEYTTGLGGAESLAAVINGNADVYVGAPSSALRARQKGTDAVVFGASITQYASNVTIAKEWAEKFGITERSSFRDKLKVLKDAHMGVVGLGSGTHQLILFLAKKAGLDPNRDLTVVNLTTAPAMLAAFQQRRIQGFSMSSPTSDMGVRDHNGIMLFYTTKGEIKELDGFLYVGFIGRDSWLKKNPDVVKRMLKAVQKALDDLRDPARTAKARDAIHAKYHAKVEKAFFDTLWANTVLAWPRTVALTPEMAGRVVDFLNEFSSSPYDRSLARTGFNFDVAASPGK